MDTLNIRRDARVVTADGELGRVSHVVVDPRTREATDIVTRYEGEDLMIPIDSVASADGDRVTLHGGLNEFLGGQRFERDAYHAVDEDDVRDQSSRTATHGGAPLLDADDEGVELDGERETMRESDRGEHPYRVELREERLRVRKEQEQAGEVRLGKRVVEHTETLSVPVREERVVIERLPGSGQVVEGGIDSTDGETIEIPVEAERVRVEKEAVVTEEVNVRTEALERTERVQASVRKEELVVENEGEVSVDGGTEDATYERRETTRRG